MFGPFVRLANYQLNAAFDEWERRGQGTCFSFRLKMSSQPKTVDLDKTRERILLLGEQVQQMTLHQPPVVPVSPGTARRPLIKPLFSSPTATSTATPPPRHRKSNVGYGLPGHRRACSGGSLGSMGLSPFSGAETSSLESSPDGHLGFGSEPRPFLGSSASFGSTSSLDQQIDEHKKVARHLVVNGIRYPPNVDDLEEQAEIGRGTSGQVARMRHRPSGKMMAVKVLQRNASEEEQKRVLMDLSVMISHDCPYIVESYGAVITHDDVYICMELMSTCLDKVLKRFRQPFPEVIVGKVAVAVVKALDYLKENHGVIHRDVKPSNILLDAQKGCFKICDFGISGRLVDSKARTRGAGCAAYMAPERIMPTTSDYDIRADVWSMGITLVELAIGAFPYQNCKSEFEVLARIMEEPPPRLPNGAQFSVDFSSFIAQCLTKERDRRPRFRDLKFHSFIQRYEHTPVNVTGWYSSLQATQPFPQTTKSQQRLSLP